MLNSFQRSFLGPCTRFEVMLLLSEHYSSALKVYTWRSSHDVPINFIFLIF